MDPNPPQVTDEVYAELYALAKRCMQSERRNHTLQPTALVNEAYLKLAHCSQTVWSSPHRFRATAAACLRHILISHARAKNAQKRGGNNQQVSLTAVLDEGGEVSEIDVLALEEVLLELEVRDPQMAKLIELRYFGGLTAAESAEELELPVRIVKEQSRFALAWLRMRLDTQTEA